MSGLPNSNSGSVSTNAAPGGFSLAAEYSGPQYFADRRTSRIEHRRRLAGIFLHAGQRGARPPTGESHQQRLTAELLRIDEFAMVSRLTEKRDNSGNAGRFGESPGPAARFLSGHDHRGLQRKQHFVSDSCRQSGSFTGGKWHLPAVSSAWLPQ